MKTFFTILLLITFSSGFSQDLTELLVNSTIKIQGVRDSIINGKKIEVQSIGTGFFFEISISNQKVPCIVTNFHVIRNCKSGNIKFTNKFDKKPKYGEIINVNFSSFGDLWVKHPTEDLAITFFTPIERRIFELFSKEPFYALFSEQEIPTSEQINKLTSIEEVIMVGYPKGFSDSINNLPITRKGITATPIFMDYNNQRRFLLDIPIYPGSSGSPIVIYNNLFSDRNGNTSMAKRFYFTGIAVESKEYAAKGVTLSKDPSKIAETKTWLPFEVAIIIKSSVLLDFKPLIAKHLSDYHFYRRIINNTHK